jgi:hypothetical protein
MRVLVLPTGRMALLGMSAALKGLFPAHDFEAIAERDDKPFDGFTSSGRPLTPTKPNGNVDKIVQQMAAELVPGRGGSLSRWRTEMPKSVITTSLGATATARRDVTGAGAAPGGAGGGEGRAFGATSDFATAGGVGEMRGSTARWRGGRRLGFRDSLGAGAGVAASPFAVPLAVDGGARAPGGLGTTALRHFECGAITP